jgi:spermidine synthase
MKRTERLGETVAPDGTVLALFRHDGAYTIRVRGVELMSTLRHHSEERLAEVGCAPLRDAAAPRVLIGGLGLGFTLRAALGILPADARVTVAELVGGIIEWNLNPEYPLAAPALADPRAELVHADVAHVLRDHPGTFDAILMDVDNGAEAFTTRANSALYSDAGVRRAAAALRPGGRIVYWSADDDPRFAAAMRRAGLEVEVLRERAHAAARFRHTLLVGRAAR